jgi:hypothetical protein
MDYTAETVIGNKEYPTTPFKYLRSPTPRFRETEIGSLVAACKYRKNFQTDGYDDSIYRKYGNSIGKSPKDVKIEMFDFAIKNNLTEEIERYLQRPFYTSMFLNAFLKDMNFFYDCKKRNIIPDKFYENLFYCPEIFNRYEVTTESKLFIDETLLPELTSVVTNYLQSLQIDLFVPEITDGYVYKNSNGIFVTQNNGQHNGEKPINSIYLNTHENAKLYWASFELISEFQVCLLRQNTSTHALEYVKVYDVFSEERENRLIETINQIENIDERNRVQNEIEQNNRKKFNEINIYHKRERLLDDDEHDEYERYTMNMEYMNTE